MASSGRETSNSLMPITLIEWQKPAEAAPQDRVISSLQEPQSSPFTSPETPQQTNAQPNREDSSNRETTVQTRTSNQTPPSEASRIFTHHIMNKEHSSTPCPATTGEH
ncbi:hypothetical protein Nepgr_001060 [Nepenthes gracilis]|uniref:Uncharacterized protein n=1 Tax=Nepenthes gracilis TaxID=150966 RepID=A0AAD3P486_NEPGR|nr:hypothetical protein Nepgr_001060 [Nepenthes gracilis]